MRQVARAAVAIALLSALGLTSLSTPASAHPYHLEVANEVIVGSDGLDAGRWLAESFPAPSSFRATRVSVYVADDGASDVLGASLRTTVIGWPASTDLTQGFVDAGPTGGWVDVDLSPWVDFVAGQRYWVVLHSAELPGDGYSWWHSGNESAYPDGIGAVSPDGASWSPRGRDFTFRVYGFSQPSLSFAVSVSNGSPRPGDQPAFRVDVANSGAGDAAFLWANVSFPTALTYASDDAASVGGVRSGAYTFTFTSVPPGSLSFNITALVNGGTPNGTVATTAFTFDSTDHDGVMVPRVTRTIPVTIRNARVSLSQTGSAPTADPGDSVTFNATARNVGLEASGAFTLAGVVDPRVFFISSSPGTTYDPGTRSVRRDLPSLAAGASVSMGWTVRVPAGTNDGTRVPSDAHASYQDVSGAAMPNETASAAVIVQAPIFSIGLSGDRGDAEKGDLVAVTLDYRNTGSAPSMRAWVNWTLGADYSLDSLTPALPYTSTLDGFDVAVADVVPGPHTLVARLRVIRGLNDGLAMPVQVRWLATDGSGNLLAPASLTVFMGLRAPSVTVGAGPALIRADSGAEFVVDVTLRNTGRALAGGWMNVTLPAGVEYAGDNGTFLSSAVGARVSWTISVPAGGTVVLGLRLRGREILVGSVRFLVNYTDGKGTAPVSVVSGSVSIDIVEPAPVASIWTWVAAAAAVATGIGGAVIVVWRRRKLELSVEEVFVADGNGLLLAHRATSIVPHQDEDVLIGMFKVVQDFVKDAFSKGTDEQMKALEFGERKILIERGRNHFIVVVYRGTNRGELNDRMQGLSRAIDDQFGDVIASWDGSMDLVRGITLLLPRIWKAKRADLLRGRAEVGVPLRGNSNPNAGLEDARR